MIATFFSLEENQTISQIKFWRQCIRNRFIFQAIDVKNCRHFPFFSPLTIFKTYPSIQLPFVWWNWIHLHEAFFYWKTIHLKSEKYVMPWCFCKNWTSVVQLVRTSSIMRVVMGSSPHCSEIFLIFHSSFSYGVCHHLYQLSSISNIKYGENSNLETQMLWRHSYRLSWRVAVTFINFLQLQT